MNLELMAMRWLWIDKGGYYILRERSPRYCMGQPDVLGVTRGRYLIEIEVKRSASDFAADFRKTHRANREMNITKMPRQFYYLMPKELAEKLRDRIPAWAGLMQSDKDSYSLAVVKVAPVNEQAQKLSIGECVKMARLMTSHMMGVVQANNTLFGNFLHNGAFSHVDWVPHKVGTYEI